MLTNTYTTDDLVERISLMRTFFGKHLFMDGEKLTVRDVLAGTTSDYTIGALEQWMMSFRESAISPLVVYEALSSIEEDLAGVPALTLYVPCLLDDEQKKRIGTWVRRSIQPNMLVTLRTDPRVVGGCAFIWKDVYYDYSLRYYIAQESERVYAMFDRHLHAK